VIELGIPFSDPLADGPIIQKATTAALAKGANIDNFFKELLQLKQSLNIPVAVMSYYNPIFKFGLIKFLKNLEQIGASALINVDMPIEEGDEYIKEARKFNIDTIFLLLRLLQLHELRRLSNNQEDSFIMFQ